MQQQPTFNFGLTKIFLLFTAHSVCGKKPKTVEIRGQTLKFFKYFFNFQVTYPDGFGLCKKREQKILTLGHL
jgi:hypothetical protein